MNKYEKKTTVIYAMTIVMKSFIHSNPLKFDFKKVSIFISDDQ